MKYKNIVKGIFISRPNRFIAYVKIDDNVEMCHVKNTGRCKEMLIPNETVVYLEDYGTTTNRKTRYSVVTVEKNSRLINMDSQAPNALVEEWIKAGNLYENITYMKREVTYGNSRFDMYIEYEDDEEIKKTFIEVKGVTLEKDNVVYFPDAPTERGIKHINELVKAHKEGYNSIIFFVIQMEGVISFSPNDETHKAFGDALREAYENGVEVMAYDCIVSVNNVLINNKVSVEL